MKSWLENFQAVCIFFYMLTKKIIISVCNNDFLVHAFTIHLLGIPTTYICEAVI